MGKLLQICVVGDANQPEFQYALSNIFNGAYVCYAASIEDFFRLNPSPDVVVMLQSYPGEYSIPEMERIIQSNPIASLILVTSSWGEGERRTGTPIRDAIRIAWYDFPCWFKRQKTLFDAGRLSQLSLPLSASDAQRAELDSQNEFPARTNDVFWIFSDSAVQRETLSRFYAPLGAQVWSGGMTTAFPEQFPLAHPARIVVFPDFLSDGVFKRIAQLKELNPNAAIYVIVYQPRIEEIESLRSNGADEILSPEFYQHAAL
ncbi:MAG: hypothetical protein IKX40_05505 [Thermoguttaceae bacterium]|nr:hypothetical protein [Thermoguttaceae bacterium]